MLQIHQQPDPVFHHGMGRNPVNPGDKAHAAVIVFVLRIVQSLPVGETGGIACKTGHLPHH